MALPPFAVDQLSRLLAYLPVSSDTDSLDRKRKQCNKRLTFLTRFHQVSPPLHPADCSTISYLGEESSACPQTCYRLLAWRVSMHSLAPSQLWFVPRSQPWHAQSNSRPSRYLRQLSGPATR